MSALHPLPEPGTVEAFVIDVLAGVALHVRRIEYEAGAPWAHNDAAWRFLAWIDACAAWCGGGLRASGHDLTRDDLVVAMRRVRDPGLDAVHIDRAVLRAAFPIPRRT